MVDGELLIYGATGYSAGLVLEAAHQEGLKPIIAGRDRSRLEGLAARLGLEYRVAPLTDANALATALKGVRVVLHAAGPFAETSPPMVEACLRQGVHYLDLTGEAEVAVAIAHRHAEARRRSVMLMPAVGFEAVPTDCLAAHVVRRFPRAAGLSVATTASPFVSRGSARTLLGLGRGSLARRAGKLEVLRTGVLEREFDFGDGPSRALSCALVDVVTAWYTTGVPDITGYLQATLPLRAAVAGWRYGASLTRMSPVQGWLRAWVATLPEGPSPQQRSTHRMAIVVEAERDGRRAASRLTTPEAYTATALCAVAVAGRVLRGDAEPGFQTPARVWGPDLVMGLPGMHREDMT